MAFKTQHPYPLAHMVYFKLVDRLPETKKRFLKYCRDYLSNHPGLTYFSVGTRAVEMQRDVNAKDFDVAMNMIFDSLESYNAYRSAPRHKEFITVTAGMSTARKVYDSYISHSSDMVSSRKNRKATKLNVRKRKVK